MALHSISIRNLRNIQSADLCFSPQANLISGVNASGKTSLLEAIQILASTRSFRSHHWQEYLSYNQEMLRIQGAIASATVDTHVGICRKGRAVQMKINGEKISRVSELAVWLPTLMIHPESYFLVSGGPKMRRQYLDWGLFHVEPQFIQQWRQYDQAIKQRNALLREKKALTAERKQTLAAWNPILDQTSGVLNQLRIPYIDALNKILPKYISAMVGNHHCVVDYIPGWETRHPLSVQLEDKLIRDCARGFTHYGPHRADLAILFDSHPAKAVLSRGQQKMLVIALLLAQLEIFNRNAKHKPLLLIDDLGAELDKEHCSRLLRLLAQLPVQLFITSTNAEIWQGIPWKHKKSFKIDAGKIQEVL